MRKFIVVCLVCGLILGFAGTLAARINVTTDQRIDDIGARIDDIGAMAKIITQAIVLPVVMEVCL